MFRLRGSSPATAIRPTPYRAPLNDFRWRTHHREMPRSPHGFANERSRRFVRDRAPAGLVARDIENGFVTNEIAPGGAVQSPPPQAGEG